MNKQTTRKIQILKKERAKLLQELRRYRDIMRGSLVLLKRRCGTEKKYPAYFLSKSLRGKTVMRYIKKAEVEAVQDSLEMPLGSNLYILHSNWHKKKIKISCSM